MSDLRVFGGALALVGLGLVAAWQLWPSQEAAIGDLTTVEDGPGPNLEIEVAGTASGRIVIDLLPEVAPGHAERLATLAAEGAYDGVVFHRVIDGFMAQTGDVEFGRKGADLDRVGTGGSARPDLAAEFSDTPFVRGTVGMARSASPDSANSQFFIMFAPASHLNGQYTVVGRVIEGMQVVDALKRGDRAGNGAVDDPDWMARVTVAE